MKTTIEQYHCDSCGRELEANSIYKTYYFADNMSIHIKYNFSGIPKDVHLCSGCTVALLKRAIKEIQHGYPEQKCDNCIHQNPDCPVCWDQVTGKWGNFESGLK